MTTPTTTDREWAEHHARQIDPKVAHHMLAALGRAVTLRQLANRCADDLAQLTEALRTPEGATDAQVDAWHAVAGLDELTAILAAAEAQLAEHLGGSFDLSATGIDAEAMVSAVIAGPLGRAA